MDEADISEFVATTYPRLVAAVSLVAGSRAAGEDAVQEALARAWERSEKGVRLDSLAAWVTTCALNLARSGLRRGRAERRARDRLAAAGTAQRELGPETADLERALARLSRRQREATVLHYYLGLPTAEVARAMGTTEGTVKTQLHRSRQALGAALATPDDEGTEVSQRARPG